jgi:hypothetical protein
LSNRISTNDNLARREIIDPASLKCIGACGKEKNVTFYFYCNYFGKLWIEVLNWLQYSFKISLPLKLTQQV